MSTVINKVILKAIQHQLEFAYPNEACGFLLGKESNRIRHINHLFEVENKSTDNQRRRFVISPLDYLHAEKFAAEEGLQLLGIYHSHPDHPAIPSAHDLEFAQPFFSYFIHSIENGKLTHTRSYRLVDENLLEEKFSIYQQLNPLNSISSN